MMTIHSSAIVRGAQERVPMGVMARMLACPYDEVVAVCRKALTVGDIAELPPRDRPAGRFELADLGDNGRKERLSLQAIPPEQLAVLRVLVQADGILTHLEIGEACGATVGAVQMRIARLRKRLDPLSIVIEGLPNGGVQLRTDMRWRLLEICGEDWL